MIIIKSNKSLLGLVVEMSGVVEAGNVTVIADVKVADDSVADVEYAIVDVNWNIYTSMYTHIVLNIIE